MNAHQRTRPIRKASDITGIMNATDHIHASISSVPGSRLRTKIPAP